MQKINVGVIYKTYEVKHDGHLAARCPAISDVIIESKNGYAILRLYNI